jgi:DNA-binding PadR family transcriptional regulator
MSEAMLLSLLLRYPHPVAIARRVSGATLHLGLKQLESEGLVRRRGGVYRVTDCGRRALEFNRDLQVAVGRALQAAPGAREFVIGHRVFGTPGETGLKS